MAKNVAERMQPQSHAGHVPASADRRALIIAGWLTGIYFFVELGMAYWSGSLAVLSDAFHTFSAVGGVLIALFAQRLSERKASLAQTYGWARAEIIGALFNGIFLLLMAGYVLWMGAMRLMDEVKIESSPGAGTTVTMRKWLGFDEVAAFLDHGASVRPSAAPVSRETDQ